MAGHAKRRAQAGKNGHILARSIRSLRQPGRPDCSGPVALRSASQCRGLPFRGTLAETLSSTRLSLQYETYNPHRLKTNRGRTFPEKDAGPTWFTSALSEKSVRAYWRRRWVALMGSTFNRNEAEVVGVGRRKHPQTPLHFVPLRLNVPPHALFRQNLVLCRT